MRHGSALYSLKILQALAEPYNDGRFFIVKGLSLIKIVHDHLPGEVIFVHQAVTKDLTASSNFSEPYVQTLQPLPFLL